MDDTATDGFDNGVPVVLVHGWAGSFRKTWQEHGWDALLADAGRTVIGVDLLGHGTAPKPHDPAAYAHLDTWLEQHLPAEGAVDAIGFSLGAMTLLQLAARAPHRFQRIVVTGVGDNLFRTERSTRIVDAVEGRGDPDDVVGQVFAQYANQPGNDVAALAACLRREAVPFTAEQLAAVTCPVLVCIGDADFAGPGDPLVAALPDARLVVLRRTDHFATPGAFACIDAALEFLGAAPG
jgi:pimeloyl-ACP methyl ester carboxylesterase